MSRRQKTAEGIPPIFEKGHFVWEYDKTTINKDFLNASSIKGTDVLSNH